MINKVMINENTYFLNPKDIKVKPVLPSNITSYSFESNKPVAQGKFNWWSQPDFALMYDKEIFWHSSSSGFLTGWYKLSDYLKNGGVLHDVKSLLASIRKLVAA